MHTDTYAMLAYTWEVIIGETAYIVNLEHFEDVLYAERQFHVGHVGEWIFILRIHGEEEQSIAIRWVGFIAWS